MGTWRLNNFLLEVPGSVENIDKETREFLQWNKGSASVITVWETFKLFICKILIACKIARDQERNKSQEELKQKLNELESKNK